MRLLLLPLLFLLSSCSCISAVLATEIPLNLAAPAQAPVSVVLGPAPVCRAPEPAQAHDEALDGAVPIRSIDAANVKPAIDKIDALVANGAKTITLHIDSRGGIINEGMKLVRAVEVHRRAGIKTVCVADGDVASMAFLILQSDACQERVATKRSMFMAHEPWTRAVGNQHALRAAAKELQVTADAMAETIGKRLKLGVKGYKQRISTGDWVFGWEEAAHVGAIDRTIEPDELPAVYKLPPGPVSIPFLVPG